ncbi:MAG: pyridoxamine 5'-phosphate oxidase family protein [Rhodoferax sp.]|uniref:pyridoxamine 5'-phosphate oxidase family protein n=1 Tax=Rhodoferax sp. TaxID=50421 RepID=UPI00262174F0|nr:pyridoxamine 5'-phosphate oxidase family protein [Rhodoferax sp.]MDD5332727.1 pyridoxamine 5'-phosphate oxidase family protein [Rhodoferax sp.]
MNIDTLEKLRALYAAPKERAVRKQLSALDSHCRRFIELSPFVVVASGNVTQAMDASPRGGAPGFVKALDERTLLIPDAPGNNRLDTLENILGTGKVGLLFMIPGIDETLRVNGAARLSCDEEQLQLFAGEKHRPKLVIEVSVAEAYLHCAKALMRSGLWQASSQVKRSLLPTMGQMINSQTGIEAPAETQEEMLGRYAADL